MHYRFSPGLIMTPDEYQTRPLIPEPRLSDMDISEVRKFYPAPAETSIPELKPYLSHLVGIDPGEQLDFLIRPDVSRKYVMHTFGDMDTVMVMFEDDQGKHVYLAGNDDSGGDTNARIVMRLIRGRAYYLRVRLYYDQATGQGAVRLW